MNRDRAKGKRTGQPRKTPRPETHEEWFRSADAWRALVGGLGQRVLDGLFQRHRPALGPLLAEVAPRTERVVGRPRAVTRLLTRPSRKMSPNCVIAHEMD